MNVLEKTFINEKYENGNRVNTIEVSLSDEHEFIVISDMHESVLIDVERFVKICEFLKENNII